MTVLLARLLDLLLWPLIVLFTRWDDAQAAAIEDEDVSAGRRPDLVLDSTDLTTVVACRCGLRVVVLTRAEAEQVALEHARQSHSGHWRRRLQRRLQETS